MRAIVLENYGPPENMRLQEVPKPVPSEHQVLVQVRASALNAADWHLMRADPFLVRLMFGLTKPRLKILGADVAGLVEAVGSAVTRFKPGDEVFGILSAGGWGAFAEFVCAPEDGLVMKPARATFEDAAAVPLAALTALQALRTVGRVRPGEKVLINGASGGVGTFAIQIATALGAEVTGVCSTRNLELVRSVGADHVIDYTTVNFTEQDKRYDVIVAANGYHPLSAYKRVPAPGGRYVMTGGAYKQLIDAILLGPWLSLTGDRTLSRVDMKPTLPDLQFLQELLEQGKIVAVIDRRYPLAQVPEAMAYLEEGHSRGKVVVTV